jgi:hypothetical protein
MWKKFLAFRHAVGLCSCLKDWPWQVYCSVGIEEKQFREWDMIGLGYAGRKS